MDGTQKRQKLSGDGSRIRDHNAACRGGRRGPTYSSFKALKIDF